MMWSANSKRVAAFAAAIILAAVLTYFIPRWRIEYGPALRPTENVEIDSSYASLSSLTIDGKQLSVAATEPIDTRPPLTFRAGEEFSFSGELDTDWELWGNESILQLRQKRIVKSPKLRQEVFAETEKRLNMELTMRFIRKHLDPYHAQRGEWTSTKPRFVETGTVTFSNDGNVPTRKGQYVLRFVLRTNPWGHKTGYEEYVLWERDAEVVE